MVGIRRRWYFPFFAVALAAVLGVHADDWREMMWEAPVALRDGVTIRAYALDKPRLMKAYVVRIDLTTQGIGFTATERADGWGRRIPEVTNRVFRRETKRETTADFMVRRRREGRNVEVAVNTTPWCPWPMPKGCEHCDPVGWCVADGVEVSRPKRREALFIVRKDGTAEITPDVPSGGTNDVAFAASAFDLLMTNGIDTISFNRPENAGLHPRTAFGLTSDRKTLVLLAIDGRQPGYSGGATLDDIRAILRREGVSDAVNMDGGGSTSLVVWDAKNGRPEMLNRHPGRTVRKNAVNFGITFSGNGSADIAGRAGGNFHSYEFNPVKDTPPPKGFKPFYIGQYARHGSRRITKSTAADTAVILAKADKNGLLTEEGVRLRDAVRRIAEVHDGMEGELLERGAEEHRRLARRMAARFPAVFDGRRRVRCRASTTPRVLLSMMNFTTALKESAPQLDVDFTTGEKYKRLVVEPHYVLKRDGLNKLIKGAVEAANAKRPVDSAAIVGRFFTDPRAVKDSARFAKDLYYCASDSQCMRAELGGLDLFGFFRPEELSAISRNFEVQCYGVMANSAEFGDKFVEASEALAQDFIDRADSAIADDRVAADLRFGHDQGVWPLAAVFGLEGPGDRVPIADAAEKCPAWEWSPMAANLQMVLYRNAKRETLVKFLYNEREMTIRGLEAVSAPYYRWNDLKASVLGERAHQQ